MAKEKNTQNIIIYNTVDGKASVLLYAKDGMVWMNQNQIAQFFATSVPNISMHIANILNEGELEKNSVIKNYLTTAANGKESKRNLRKVRYKTKRIRSITSR